MLMLKKCKHNVLKGKSTLAKNNEKEVTVSTESNTSMASTTDHRDSKIQVPPISSSTLPKLPKLIPKSTNSTGKFIVSYGFQKSKKTLINAIFTYKIKMLSYYYSC